MTKKKGFWSWLLGAGIGYALVFMLFACRGGPAPQPSQAQKAPKTTRAKKPTAKEKEQALEEKKELGWVYDPTGKRDPFQPPREVTAKLKVVNPLLKYDLEQMWIDGIILGEGRDIAHIILPDGSDHFVRVGTILGINRGIVKQILPDGIVVEERYIDPKNPEEIRIVEKILRMETAEEEKRKLEQILK